MLRSVAALWVSSNTQECLGIELAEHDLWVQGRILPILTPTADPPSSIGRKGT